MAQLSKVLLSLPTVVLDEVDDFVSTCSVTRSGFIRDAMIHYLAHCKKMERRDSLIKGYELMAKINKDWANSCCEADNETQFDYELLLAESSAFGE